MAGAVETEEFVLACWEKKKGKIEKNKNKIFYLLNINYITLTSNMGPGQVEALGRCPSCPGSRPGLILCKENLCIFLPFFSFFTVFHPMFQEPNTEKKNQMRYYFPTFIFVNGSLEFNAYRITMVNSIMSKKKST